jgi:hypothetical protein
MAVIDRLPSLDAKALTAIEQNAQRWLSTGTDKQKAEAESVLLAISNERRRRRDDADQDQRRLGAEVAEKVRDKALFDRVLMAFSDLPPEHWEVEVLKEIASKPGRDFDTLAHAIGKRGGGYINLAVGTLCSAREAYLGPAHQHKRPRGRRSIPRCSSTSLGTSKPMALNGTAGHSSLTPKPP